MKVKLIDFIKTEKLLLDGSMGAQLAMRGCDPGGGKNNITHPETVLALHREYIRAGCQALITNTLTMNRLFISSFHPELDILKVNKAGAQLAKEAAGGSAFVLGNIGSSGQLMEPYGPVKEDDYLRTIREQASILGSEGVDGFFIETMVDLNEALCALRACREFSPSVPVFVSMTFSSAANGGRTIMGNSAADCAKAVQEKGGSAVGANCGEIDPAELAGIIREMRSVVSIPIIAEPNAGKPFLIDGKTVFKMPPDVFARGLEECVKAGATIVGGCCGTSPEHIRKAREMLDATQ